MSSIEVENQMPSNLVGRKWRQRKGHPNVMIVLVLLAILVGCAFYILIFPWELESSEPDYYYNRLESNKSTFEPTQFRKFDKPNVLFRSTDFKYLSGIPDRKSLCKPSVNKTKTILIMVTSLRRNIGIRELIRRTWGSLRRVPKWSIKLVFVLGAKQKFQDESIYKSILDQEIADRKDMIIGNFDEEYGTRKINTHLMAYKWALTFCFNAEFILKTTDSTFVDIFQVIELASFTSPINTMVCGKRQGYKTEEGWIPEHCRPEAMLLSMDVAERLYLTTSGFDELDTGVGDNATSLMTVETQLGPDDQILITGDVVQSLDIPVTDIANQFLNEPATAFEWARNGKQSRDQRLHCMFVVMPDATDFYAKKGITDLWRKILKVNSLVYEFQLSHSPRIQTLQQEIEANFKDAPHKLNS
ncbi:Beta-1,3-galactosyltransferase 4 [Orchesella cincta]|uniref:Hexosyltransferase n=1 Tax=Orchesella cincta TaxID=48709 RepID=A0A1D2NCP7_ORCCI|nr:Beta-1,3-galactosyltransferase 4 [Orchesella cincta]